MVVYVGFTAAREQRLCKFLHQVGLMHAKLARNVEKSPSEQKFRRIKMSNPAGSFCRCQSALRSGTAASHEMFCFRPLHSNLQVFGLCYTGRQIHKATFHREFSKRDGAVSAEVVGAFGLVASWMKTARTTNF